MDLHLDIDNAVGRSLRERLQISLREAVRSGRLAPGARLPSTRSLAVELGVSRGVVSEAYAQLVAEGYLHARHGAGTTVASGVFGATSVKARAARQMHIRYDLNPFRPALDGFPRAAWLAALGRVVRSVPDEQLGYPDPLGVPRLRQVLASYLGRVRGVRVEEDRVLVTAGVRQGLALLWQTFASQAGQGVGAIAVEQPGWRGIAETAIGAGLELAPIPVDEQGLQVDRLCKRDDIGAVVVAPAHQYPTGAVLSASRRTELLAWARRTGGLIFEDDYDAEYRYDRRPIGSLQGLAPEHVVYAGSASKTIAPALRLGWLVLPARLAGPVAETQRRGGGMPSPLDQLACADLIERGELDRHLRRQRNRYKRRRDAVLQALATRLPDMPIRGVAAGLFVVLDLPDRMDERAVLARARASGIAIEGVGGKPNGLIIGYANLDVTAAPHAIGDLAAAIRQTAREGSPVAPAA